MRTWKMDGPPEIVDGIVMNVMTSCSLRPARRARKPPMAWMPSWELPAKRITASEIFVTLRAAADTPAVDAESLMLLNQVLPCPGNLAILLFALPKAGICYLPRP